MPTLSNTVFIADLHLDKRYPLAVKTFLRYLRSPEAQCADALYILGDLFEYWLGDDCVDATAEKVAAGLMHYTRSTSTPIYFIHGNRDFLLGEDYAARCGMTILPEHHVIDLYGEQTLILHGDTLCTDDIAYQQFRRQTRNPQWQQKMLRLPGWIRQLKALQMRWRSKNANRKKTEAIMDTVPNTVQQFMHDFGVTQMIHGHTHRPAIHRWATNGTAYQRNVVGDWYTQGSVLVATPRNKQLIELTITKED